MAQPREGGRAVGRGRRAAGRALLVGSLVALAAALALPSARAQDAEPDAAAAARPESFGGAASATALGVSIVTPSLVPVEGLFDLAVVEGRGTYEQANQEGRASLLFPGNGGVSGASLLCGTFLAPNIPPEGAPLFGPILEACGQYRYPLAVYVDSLSPDGSTDGQLALGRDGDPIALRAVGATAHAADDGTTTRAQAADLRLLGAPAIGSLAPLLRLAGLDPLDGSLVAVDGLTARTDQAIVDGRLVVTADAKVSGLRLLGGLVRIGTITSRSTLRTGGDAADEVASDVEVGGVTVAGQPAQVTEDGLVVTGSSTGPVAQQLARAATEALRGLGVRIEALEATQGDDDGIPVAQSQGVLVELTTPIAGLPPVPGPLGDIDLNGAYGVRLTLGSTGVRGFADTFDDGADPGDPDLGGTDGFLPLPSDPVDLGPLGPVVPPVGPATPSTATTAVEPTDGEPVADRFGDRLPLLYLSFTLGVLALCLAPPFTVPARLPGARP